MRVNRWGSAVCIAVWLLLGSSRELDAQTTNAIVTKGTVAGEADVLDSTPVGTEWGLVVRCIGCGSGDPSSLAGGPHTLDSLSETATFVFDGTVHRGVGIDFNSSDFIGTLRIYYSIDGGTDFHATTFGAPIYRVTYETRVYTGASVNESYSIVVPSGADRVLVSVAAYTSGAMTARFRSSMMDDHTAFPFVGRESETPGPIVSIQIGGTAGGGGGGEFHAVAVTNTDPANGANGLVVRNTSGMGATDNPAPPLTHYVGGKDADSPDMRSVLLDNEAPTGSEFGVITRNIPSGTQTVVFGSPPTVNQGTQGTNTSPWFMNLRSAAGLEIESSTTFPAGCCTNRGLFVRAFGNQFEGASPNQDLFGQGRRVVSTLPNTTAGTIAYAYANPFGMDRTELTGFYRQGSATSGSLVNAGDTVAIGMGNNNVETIRFAGTFAGVTVIFEGSGDFGVFEPILGWRIDGVGAATTSPALADNSTTTWTVPLPGGAASGNFFSTFRVRLVGITSGTVGVQMAPSTQGVTNPPAVTDAQLRATPVPVSGPLTDLELRATPVPVSGTVSITAGGLVSTKTALTFNAPGAAAVGVVSAVALASNASRKGAIFKNTSNNTISCAVGATAVLNSGITLEPGDAWSMNEYSFATGAVNCIASAAASNLSLQEMQ